MIQVANLPLISITYIMSDILIFSILNKYILSTFIYILETFNWFLTTFSSYLFTSDIIIEIVIYAKCLLFILANNYLGIVTLCLI